MKTGAAATPAFLTMLWRGLSGLLRASCIMLLSRPRLAQPWTAGSGERKKRSDLKQAPEMRP